MIIKIIASISFNLRAAWSPNTEGTGLLLTCTLNGQEFQRIEKLAHMGLFFHQGEYDNYHDRNPVNTYEHN